MKGFPELFGAIVDWSIAHGADRISELPGCWEHAFEFEGAGAPSPSHTGEER